MTTTPVCLCAAEERIFFYIGLGDILVFDEGAGIQGRETKRRRKERGRVRKKSERLSVWLFWQTAEAGRQQKL